MSYLNQSLQQFKDPAGYGAKDITVDTPEADAERRKKRAEMQAELDALERSGELDSPNQTVSQRAKAKKEELLQGIQYLNF